MLRVRVRVQATLTDLRSECATSTKDGAAYVFDSLVTNRADVAGSEDGQPELGNWTLTQLLVSDARPSAASAGVPSGGRTWAVEFDGPDHFLACGSPKGRTLLKHRHLRQLGYALVVVPYWEWGKVSGDEASEAGYLRGKLGLGSV